MDNFSKTAKKNMFARHNDRGPVVGSVLSQASPRYYKNHRIADCITFVWRVIKESYIELGRPDIPKNLLNYARVRRWGRSTEDFYGDLLAKALVEKYNWIAIYLTPDSVHPNDGKLRTLKAQSGLVKGVLIQRSL